MMELINTAQNFQTALKELNNKLEGLGNAINKTELTQGFGEEAGRKKLKEDARNNNEGNGDLARKRKKVHWS